MLPDDGTSISRWIPWFWMPKQSMMGKEAQQTLGDSEHPCLSKAVLCIISEPFPTPSWLSQQLLLTWEKSSCFLRIDDIFKVSLHIPAYINIFMIKIVNRKMLFKVYWVLIRISYHIKSCSANCFGLGSDIPNSQRKKTGTLQHISVCNLFKSILHVFWVLFLFCVYGCFVCVNIYAPHVCSAHRSQKKALNILKLKFQKVGGFWVSCCVDVWTRTQILQKSSQCPLTSEPYLQPHTANDF